MFISDKVVFVELHKTGCSHIGHWLQQLIEGGEQIGKHNRLPSAYHQHFVLGSIRNPWDWYVSLWAYGSSGLGSIHTHVNQRYGLVASRQQVKNEFGKPSLRYWLQQYQHEQSKPVADWHRCYQNADDPILFRQWLKLIMDVERRFDIGEAYGFSPLSKSFGVLTYRYVRLFTKLGSRLFDDSKLAGLSGLEDAVDEHKIVNYVILNENLERGLLDGLNEAGIKLSVQQEQSLLDSANHKINASSHRDSSYYYDDESIALVAEKEQYLIDQYNYQPPV